MYDLAVAAPFPTIQYGFITQAFPRHDHRQWEIHLFTSGRGSLIQDGVAWPVTAGSVAFSPPGHAHELTVEGVLTFYYLQFSSDTEVAAILRRLYEDQVRRGPRKVDDPALAEVGRLKDRLDSPEPDRVVSGLHGFRAWLYDLAVGRPEVLPDGVDLALVWLRQNLNRPLGLEELAGVAGLDRFAFCRRFKARTGLSPLAYVHRSKVEAAGFLLTGTQLTLGDVASRLGFCDEFHFGKVFKKWRGVSPGRWRQSHRPSRVSPGNSSP